MAPSPLLAGSVPRGLLWETGREGGVTVPQRQHRFPLWSPPPPRFKSGHSRWPLRVSTDNGDGGFRGGPRHLWKGLPCSDPSGTVLRRLLSPAHLPYPQLVIFVVLLSVVCITLARI